MKVLSVLTYYYPHWTGLTAHAQRLAEGLVRRGHSVTALAYQHARTLAAHAMHDGVAIVRVRPLARISRGMIGPAFPAAAARLLRDHDVALINSPMLESLPIALASRAVGRPAVLVHHGDLVMRGERRHESDVDERDMYRAERFYGSFMRRVPLPPGAEPDEIEARFQDGVLEVTVPLHEGGGEETRQIEIQ